MGVPGLWDILNKAGKSSSLFHLAVVNGFDQNLSGRRAYRIGIDTSIWLHHAYSSKGGENAELRGLFFRLVFLAKMPIKALFIFDGRERPGLKRGSRKGKSGSHPLSINFKRLISAFGMEWHEADGEAEAELAYLNKIGVIDAIMTDDVDAFIFGAQTVIKNISSKLSGNQSNLAKNSDDKTDKFHTMVYTSNDLKNNPEISMSRGGLVLFALLSGGDYHKGVDRFGKVTAHALARCEFGDELLQAYQNLGSCKFEFNQFLEQWRERINGELKENRRGFLPHRTSLSLPTTFPDMEILKKYANPLDSSGNGRSRLNVSIRDDKELKLPEIAELCEEFFEWGYRTKIIERFRSLMWPCAVMHVLRRAALQADRHRELSGLDVGDIGTPPSKIRDFLGIPTDRIETYADAFANQGTGQQVEVDPSPLIQKIVGNREHASVDGLLEYRVEVCPVHLVQISMSGIKGKRQEPEQSQRHPAKKPEESDSLLRLWVPATMISAVHPSMIKAFLVKKRNGGRRKKNKEEEPPTPSSSQTLVETESEADIDLRSGVSGYSKPNTSGFLFTFPNPDSEEVWEEISKATPTVPDEVEDSSPLTQYELLCDRILTAPLKPGHNKRKRNQIPQRHRQFTSKKQNTSQILAALDGL